MKPSLLFSFASSAATMLAMSVISRSHADAPNHVYELRLYCVAAGKMDASTARPKTRVQRKESRP